MLFVFGIDFCLSKIFTCLIINALSMSFCLGKISLAHAHDAHAHGYILYILYNGLSIRNRGYGGKNKKRGARFLNTPLNHHSSNILPVPNSNHLAFTPYSFTSGCIQET